MKEHWYRAYHGMPSDPKLKVVAMRASHATSRRVTIATVLAVWNCMLDCASQASPRGTLEGWSAEDIAALLEIDQVEIDAIHVAMQGKMLDGKCLMAWEKRQPKREREDPTAAERKRAQRERDAAAQGCDSPMSRHVTDRGEERRGEKKEQVSHSVGDADSRPPRATQPTPEPSASQGQSDRAKITKDLIDRGIVGVNPTHAKFARLLAAGVAYEEFRDAAIEAVSAGKTAFGYVLGVVEGRRRDAAAAGAVPARAAEKPMTGSGAHRLYIPEKRCNIAPEVGEKHLATILKTLRITPTKGSADAAEAAPGESTPE